MGHVGRFASVDAHRFRRETDVICRTSRGLEIGRVLAPVTVHHAADSDGQLIRAMTREDRLLAERIERHKEEALEACHRALVSRHIPAVLVDVELLFDGTSLFFYFLGEPTDQLAVVTRELADVYDSKVHFRQFAETLTVGCGPDCGTLKGDGCDASCAGCIVAAGCSPRR